jgi:hypothetical protein
MNRLVQRAGPKREEGENMFTSHREDADAQCGGP